MEEEESILENLLQKKMRHSWLQLDGKFLKVLLLVHGRHYVILKNLGRVLIMFYRRKCGMKSWGTSWDGSEMGSLVSFSRRMPSFAYTVFIIKDLVNKHLHSY